MMNTLQKSGATNVAVRENKNRKTILIVEDEAELVAAYLHLLSDSFSVITASDGAQAVNHLKNHPGIHLALVDVMLPDMSGIEVLKEIKRTAPGVPVIIITGFGNEHIAVKAFRYGARDYIKKPFRYGELLGRINFCLSLEQGEKIRSRKALMHEPEDFGASVPCESKAGDKNHNLQRALDYIDNNYEADISLEQVANIANVSKYHFSRVFKKSTGLTYQSYLNRVRIEQAKRLLNEHALSVTDTAYAVGYSDLTHFERIFKRLVGSTPSQYRCQPSSLSTNPDNRRPSLP